MAHIRQPTYYSLPQDPTKHLHPFPAQSGANTHNLGTHTPHPLVPSAIGHAPDTHDVDIPEHVVLVKHGPDGPHVSQRQRMQRRASQPADAQPRGRSKCRRGIRGQQQARAEGVAGGDEVEGAGPAARQLGGGEQGVDQGGVLAVVRVRRGFDADGNGAGRGFWGLQELQVFEEGGTRICWRRLGRDVGAREVDFHAQGGPRG